MEEETARALVSVLMSPNEMDANGEAANVVDGLFFVGRCIVEASRLMGGSEGSTSGVEFLAMEIREGSERIASSLSELASAIRETGRR